METKTLYFRADQVHDFAWFADKRFRVCTDTLQLPSGRVIDTWAFFTDEDGQHWQSALSYIKAATRYYSDRVGEYPYPQVTAVQSTGSAGGGMEYPMITLIGEVYSGYDLDEVITHEVGHNWFYSVLANNERDHAWMDEGLNSLFERAYLSERYDYPYELPGWLQGRAQMGPQRADVPVAGYPSSRPGAEYHFGSALGTQLLAGCLRQARCRFSAVGSLGWARNLRPCFPNFL